MATPLIDVRRSPELQAAILAMRRIDAPLRKAVFAASRREVNALWLPALQRRARNAMDQAVVVKGARAAVRVDGFQLTAATSRRKLSGGLVPAEDWAGVEFGARTTRRTFEQTSPKGTRYSVTKTVNRQFRGRQRDGQIAYDAASEVGTKTVAAWVLAIVETLVDASQGEATA